MFPSTPPMVGCLVYSSDMIDQSKPVHHQALSQSIWSENVRTCGVFGKQNQVGQTISEPFYILRHWGELSACGFKSSPKNSSTI